MRKILYKSRLNNKFECKKDNFLPKSKVLNKIKMNITINNNEPGISPSLLLEKYSCGPLIDDEISNEKKEINRGDNRIAM